MIKEIDFLKEGILLENIGVIIPWNKQANEIEQYGNPVVEVVNTDNKTLVWNNAKVFGGLQLNLQAQFRKSFGGKPKFDSIFGYLNEKEFDKALIHLVNYFGRKGMIIKESSNKLFYLWVCNDVEVKLGMDDRFGSNFYLQVGFIKKTGSLFVLKYWMLTLITAPLFFLLIINSLPAFSDFVLSDFEFYPLLLVFSILFSIPTLLIIWLAFIVLSYTRLSQLSIKLITVAFTLAGINITLLLISGSIAPELMAAYSITAILVGLFLIYIEGRKKKN